MKNSDTSELVEAAAGSPQSQPWSSWIQTNLNALKSEFGDEPLDIPVVLWMIDKQGKFILSEGGGLSDLDLEPGEVVGKSIYDFYAEVPEIIDCAKRALEGETVHATVEVNKTYWKSHYYPTRNARGKITGVTGISFNVTQQQEYLWRQEAVIKVASALRSADSRKDMPAAVLESMAELLDLDGAAVLIRRNPGKGLLVEDSMGPMESIQGQRIRPDDSDWFSKRSKDIISSTELFTAAHLQEPLPFPAGDKSLAGVPLTSGDLTIGVLWLLRGHPWTEAEEGLLHSIGDMTGSAFQRAAQHERTERRLHRLSALHAIDQAITGTFDLNVTLNVILDQVVTQLGVDAADIFLYKPQSHSLVFGEGRGFNHTDSSHQETQDRVGLLWQVARERALVNIPNLPQRTQTFVRRTLIEEEKFITYFGIPLIAKGEIKGVLEIFHRDLLQVDDEWLSFFKTLASQAAIAIDNAALFENLRKSNMKLDLAYHATLEGWVRALDLKDEETEGHTQRVIQRTLRLAKAMGIKGEDLIHIRRGALLHDIGKLGIPDDILNKPGPLTDEEWEEMKKHPTYAQEMLSEIEFLHPSLDIPYCHHEKWDGSGYPRGLKEERIPLPARIFAVVDVWDALTSDRPYRNAWPEEKAIQYILDNAGSHFDPQVVETWKDEFDIQLDQEQEIEGLFR